MFQLIKVHFEKSLVYKLVNAQASILAPIMSDSCGYHWLVHRLREY